MNIELMTTVWQMNKKHHVHVTDEVLCVGVRWMMVHCVAAAQRICALGFGIIFTLEKRLNFFTCSLFSFYRVTLS